MVEADTTSVLRPTADGGNDSASWTNTTGAACNTANCYTEVIETSGALCTNSDGDTTFISSQDVDVSQTFDLNESSIPDGSTVSSVEISVCYIKQGGGAGNPTFQTRICVDGSCSNSGTTLTTATSYQESSQTHSVSLNKTSSTDIEIGVMAAKKNVRVSQISAMITYTTPAPTSTPTPTPDEGDGATVETVHSGIGGNTPARIVFSGKAFPGATLGVYLIGKEYGQVLIDEEFKTQDDGSFQKEIISPVPERRLYGLLIKDKDGNLGKSKFFTYDLKFNTIVHQENLIFAPSIKTNKVSFTRNELLLVSGYAAPVNTVEALADGKVIGKTTVESDGQYKLLINTDDLVLGSYKVQARQVDPGSGKTGDVSETKTVRISSFPFANIDFNQDDQVNISDWSIFLSNWSSSDANTQMRDDLNGDKKINVTDFSVFLVSFQLSSGR